LPTSGLKDDPTLIPPLVGRIVTSLRRSLRMAIDAGLG
jgi:hypothetical protein